MELVLITLTSTSMRKKCKWGPIIKTKDCTRPSKPEPITEGRETRKNTRQIGRILGKGGTSRPLGILTMDSSRKGFLKCPIGVKSTKCREKWNNIKIKP